MKIDGLDEVLQNLLSLNIDDGLERKALNAAGKITQEGILNEAKFGSRSRSEGNKGAHSRGVYKENVKLKRPKDGEIVVHSGGAYHAHLIEFGRSGGSTKPKKGNKKSVSWGPTAPNPVFARGFGASVEPAKQAMIDEIKKGLKL